MEEEAEDIWGLGEYLMKDIPAYLQVNRDPLAPPNPSKDEVDSWREQVLSRWLPVTLDWEELQVQSGALGVLLLHSQISIVDLVF